MNKRNTRDLGLHNTGAGKGDADRSPGWRDHYDEINWPCGGKDPRKFRKVYGAPLASSIPENLEVAIEFLKMQPLIEDAKKMTERDFGGACHFSIGMHLRNTWGLWNGSPLREWFRERGIYHAEDMSGIILDSFWRTVNGQPVELDAQIKHYQDYWKETRWTAVD